jgi:hypothetical protein
MIAVTYELLAGLAGLCFPEGTEIECIQDRFPESIFDIVLSHPDLPEVAEGAAIPSYDPKYGSELVNGEHYEPRFLGWGNEYYPVRLVRRDESLEQIAARFKEALDAR